MARNARDLHLLTAVLAGHDIEDPFSVPIPMRAVDTDGLRIGLMEQFLDNPVDPEIKATVLAAGQALRDLGYVVEEFKPRNVERAVQTWWFFFTRLPASMVKQVFDTKPEDAHWTGLELLNMALQEPEPTANDVLTQFAIRDKMRVSLLKQMEESPVLLLPACAVPAWNHRQRSWEINGRTIGLLEAMSPVTPFNLFGLPAVVIPFGQTADGRPIGVQLVGRPYEDELLLELADRLEEARGLFPTPY